MQSGTPDTSQLFLLHSWSSSSGGNNICKLSHFSAHLPWVSPCSHTATCPEPTMPQVAIHLCTSRLLWNLVYLGGRQTPFFEDCRQHRLPHFQLQTGPIEKTGLQHGFGPPQQVLTTQLDWCTKCEQFRPYCPKKKDHLFLGYKHLVRFELHVYGKTLGGNDCLGCQTHHLCHCSPTPDHIQHSVRRAKHARCISVANN